MALELVTVLYQTSFGPQPVPYRTGKLTINGAAQYAAVSLQADAAGDPLWGAGDKPVTATLFSGLKTVAEQLRDGLVKKMTAVSLTDYTAGGTWVRSYQDGTDTESYTVAANTAVQILPANSSRRLLSILNIDTGQAYYGYGASLYPGRGIPLDPAAAAGQAGGGYEEPQAHKGAVYAVSDGPTTLIIVEG